MARISVKYYSQNHGFSCGPACAQMMLEAFGIMAAEEELIEVMGAAAGKGTPMENWSLLAGRYPVTVRSGMDSDLESIVKMSDEGWQVALLITADVPHYVLFLGEERGRIFFHDPWHRPDEGLSVKEFMDIWKVGAKWSRYFSSRWFVALTRNFS